MNEKVTTRAAWSDAMRAIAEERIALSAAKNANYAGGDENTDAFHNFRLVEHVTHGRIPTEIGIFVRLTDKYARLANLLNGSVDQVGESIEDTLKDLANYADILLQLIREKKGATIGQNQNTGSFA